MTGAAIHQCRYKIVSDDDGHHYVIPVHKKAEWEHFVDDNGETDCPDWA